MPADPLAAACPACGSERLHWSVRRWDRETTSPVRYFAWECLSCGETWAEPIVLGSDPIIEVPRERKPGKREPPAPGG
jgi:uncharacterized Zn finger protein